MGVREQRDCNAEDRVEQELEIQRIDMAAIAKIESASTSS